MDGGECEVCATGRADASHATGEQELIAQLQAAVTSRQLVGQATGVLVATYRIPAEQAWQMLSSASQHANIKVLRLADAVVQVASGSAWVDDVARDAVARYLLPDCGRTAAGPPRGVPYRCTRRVTQIGPYWPWMARRIAQARVASWRLNRTSGSVRSCPETSRSRCKR